MDFLKKADNILVKVLNLCTTLPFLGLVILVFCQVWTRFMTDSSLTWSEELSRYLMCYMIFFGAIHVAREKNHIRIENLTGKLTGIPRKVIAVISGVLQIVFLGIVTYGYFAFMPIAATRVSATNHIPMTFVYLCVPISCAFMAIYFLRDIIQILTEKASAGGEK